ncbi:MAG: AI-2E family transporter [Oscillospiraceae bacterium]|nr:AI-2E family transporter [Oscillospiraceae bacterium]
MKVKMDERHRSVARTAVWVFTICLMIGIAVWRWESLVAVFRKALSVLAPVILGVIFAYLMSPMQSWIEKQLIRLTDRKKPHPKIRRGLSVGITILVFLAAITGLIASIVPELISSSKNLLGSLPEYLTNITDWINSHIASLQEDQPQVYSFLISFWNNTQNSLTDLAGQFAPKLDSIASGGADLLSVVTSSAVSVFKWIANIFLGLIIMIYLLCNKENYLAQMRKLLYALLPEKKVHDFLRIGSHVSFKFMHFLSGKTVDSFLIGLLCFIGMTILKMPYITLISILVGVTNIIPFFGPIIGAVPSALLILLSEPRKLIPFVIFILVLQQFDGNFLGPKILGESLGLPMFWILFAITIGGGMFGFVGMVAFVPLFAAVYTLLSDFLSDRLNKKGLPADTKYYMTNEIHYAVPQEAKAEVPEPESETPDLILPADNPEDSALPESGDDTPDESEETDDTGTD